MSSDIIRQNLRLVWEKRCAVDSLSTSLYQEYANLLRAEHALPPTAEEAASQYESLRTESSPALLSTDFARFCLALASAYPNTYGAPEQDRDADTPSRSPKIAYLQNTFSDRAYRLFEKHFSRVSAQYFPDFRAVCEEVYDGFCSHAMLPVSSSRDGQLLSFRHLIEKYDLKITAAADVAMNDDTVMRFALLQKSLPAEPSTPPRFLDLAVIPAQPGEISALLSALECLGTVLLSCTAHPTESADGTRVFDFELDISHPNREALFLFLEGSRIRYSIFGLYDLLTQ